jgi:CspA family cold shock protein
MRPNTDKCLTLGQLLDKKRAHLHTNAAYSSNKSTKTHLKTFSVTLSDIKSRHLVQTPSNSCTWDNNNDSDVFQGHHLGRRTPIMPTGTVKWFNNAKGYGFILADEGGEDLFAHYSAITMEGYKTLKAGQQVTFEVTKGDKGLHAVNITAPANEAVMQHISRTSAVPA